MAGDRKWLFEEKNVPEGTFGSDAQVLQDEPDAHVVVWVGELEGADAEAAYQVSCEHAAGGGARVLWGSGEAYCRVRGLQRGLLDLLLGCLLVVACWRHWGVRCLVVVALLLRGWRWRGLLCVRIRGLGLIGIVL